MRRNIFHDEANTTYTYGNRKNELSKDISQKSLNCFKLRNGCLNSKLCAKRKLLHSDENGHASFVKKETLKFVIKL